MAQMRAKFRLNTIQQHGDGKAITSETLQFSAVAAKQYPADGSDEDNTYAKFSPSATCQINVANPALLGKFIPGETYYVDFTKVEPAA